jgi:hypothetical protein
LISGNFACYPKSDRVAIHRTACEMAMRHPNWAFRNPDKLARAQQQQGAAHDRFVQFFGRGINVMSIWSDWISAAPAGPNRDWRRQRCFDIRSIADECATTSTATPSRPLLFERIAGRDPERTNQVFRNVSLAVISARSIMRRKCGKPAILLIAH